MCTGAGGFWRMQPPLLPPPSQCICSFVLPPACQSHSCQPSPCMHRETTLPLSMLKLPRANALFTVSSVPCNSFAAHDKFCLLGIACFQFMSRCSMLFTYLHGFSDVRKSIKTCCSLLEASATHFSFNFTDNVVLTRCS